VSEKLFYEVFAQLPNFSEFFGYFGRKGLTQSGDSAIGLKLGLRHLALIGFGPEFSVCFSDELRIRI
jgi:hypothetical protein